MGDGRYVMVEDDELDEIAPGRSRSLEISAFVDLDQIDPIYFDKSYYLAPTAADNSKTYALLRDAMAESNQVGVCTFVMRGKEHLAAIRVSGTVLVLETLFFADEIRNAKKMLEHLPGKLRFNKGELDMAVRLIELMAQDWKPRSYRDTYTERVNELIEANFGALEWHAWTSQVDEPAQPTYALIDLDPGAKTTWAELLTLARLHRTALEHVGVRAWPKLTGRRGIQVWIPIRRGPSFDATRDWVETLSRAVGAIEPDLVSWKWQVKERRGLARLDYTQNAVNKTLVAPYSPRPSAGAPVSAPIDWDELDDEGLRSDRFTIRTIFDRLDQRGDLFSDMLRQDQSLPPLQ